MIQSAVWLDRRMMYSKSKPEHVNVIRDDDGKLKAFSWLRETNDAALYPLVKRKKGVWDSGIEGWTFEDPAVAQGILDSIIEKHADWLVIDSKKPGPLIAHLSGISFSRMRAGTEIDACLIQLPLPHFSNITIDEKIRIFRVSSENENVGLLIGSRVAISKTAQSMEDRGATCNDELSKKWPFNQVNKKIQVKVTGWAVQAICDLANPAHYLIAPQQKSKWVGKYPNTTKVDIPWDGIIHTTRKLWPLLKNKIEERGLEFAGDDPGSEMAAPTKFDTGRVAGWNSPAPNGHLLHAYQKEGAQFCASRGMRALIGDEMGVGKTAQAIAAIEAVDAPRVLIICPSNARYVWEREIAGWGGRGDIQHITSQLDKLDMSCRWHIATYDLIATRTESWTFNDKQEMIALAGASTEIDKTKKMMILHPKKRPSVLMGKKDWPFERSEPLIKEITFPIKVTFDEPMVNEPWLEPGLQADQKRVAAWKKMMRRLRGELVEQFLSAGKMTVIMDEAHRAKNKNAKRTKAIQRIARGETQLLMLTGTPLRNNEHEAAVLLGLLDAGAAEALSKDRGYTTQDVKDYLGYFMIRRTKNEVLPELPEKTRQRVDIGALDPEEMCAYFTCLDLALKSYILALNKGASEAEARQSMRGGIEQARTALGVAKVRGGEVVDLVIDVVENKECCVVFCAHQQVSDELKAQIEKNKLKVAVVDGRTPAKERANIVKDFQEGKLDVFIGGINAAGEGITLTRADTVIFVELDWVPAALMQAEDRIHRVGQRKNCQIIQMIAKTDGKNLDEMMIDLLGSKLLCIGNVLSESTSNIVSDSIQNEIYKGLIAAPVSRLPVISDQKTIPKEPAAPAKQLSAFPVEAVARQEKAQSATLIQQAHEEPTVPAPVIEKRGRGRPKVYVRETPPTATERSRRSVKALAEAVGKRVMLRLSPEAHEALKVIMTITGGTQETSAINQVLIDKRNDLLKESSNQKR